jgi:tetratricopeptide (TPR) repeat protein
VGLTLFKGKEKTAPQVSRHEEDTLGKVSTADVWKLSADATVNLVKDLISLLQSVPFARALHMHAPSRVPDRVQQIIDTVSAKVTELEVKFNAVVPSIDLYYHLGCAYFNLGRFADAENYFKKCTVVNDSDFRSLHALALTRMELGKHMEALETMKRVIELEPNNEVGWYTMGLVLYELKKHDDELECYERAIAINRQYEPAWNNRGLTLYELGRYGEAGENFAEALKINPRSENFWHGIGLVHMKLNELDTALKDFETAIKLNAQYAEAWYNMGFVLYQKNKFKDALSAVENALNLRKEFRDALILKGKILEKLGRHDDALSVFNSVIDRWPDNTDAYVGKAMLMERLGKTKEALEALDNAIKYSEDILAYKLKGDILKKHEAYEDALRQYLVILERDKSNYSVMRSAAECLFALKKFDSAAEIYKKILSVQVNAHDAWFWKGKCDLKRNAVDEGLQAIEMAISLAPKNVDYIRFMIRSAKDYGRRDLYLKYEDMLASVETDNPDVWYEKANAYFENGKVEEARVAVEKALALKNEHVDALVLYGRILFMNEEFQKAAEVVESAIELDNTNLGAWLLLGSIKNKMGEHAETLVCAERALEIRENAEAHYLRGMALRALGRYAEAGNAFSRSFELDSTYIKAVIARAEVLEQMNSYDSAFESYLLAYQKRPENIELLGKLIEIAERLSKLDEAVRLIEDAISRNENNAELWFAHGRILLKKSDTERAIKSLEHALAIAPQNTAVLTELFNAYTAAQMYENAVKVGLRLVEVNETPDIWFLIGVNLEKIGKYERALECYQQCVELEPNFVNAHIAMGKLYEKKGEIDKARDAYRRAVEIDARAYEACLALSRIFKEEGAYEDALNWIEKAIEANGTADAYVEKGRILALMGKLNESASAYEQAFSANAGIPEILYEKALVLEKLGLPAQAIDTLERNLKLHRHYQSVTRIIQLYEQNGNIERAILICEDALAHYPEQKKALTETLEKLLVKNNNTEKLLDLYERMLAEPNDEIFYKKARVLYTLKRYDEARDAIEKCNELDVDGILLYSRILSALGKVEDALSLLTKSLRTYRNSVPLSLEKGKLLVQLGRTREATKVVEGILEGDPENLEALMLLGELRMHLGEYESAIEIFERVGAKNPSNELNKRIGDAYYRLHHYEKALEKYASVLEEEKDTEVMHRTAEILLTLNRSEEALKILDALITIVPDNASYYVLKGNALTALGRYIYALECFNNAIKMDAMNAGAWFGRGLTLAKIGDFDEALKSAEKVLSFGRSVEGLKLRARMLYEIGRYPEANTAYDEMLSEGDLEILLGKALTLEKLGSDEALRWFDKVLEQNPDNVQACYHKARYLVNIGRNKEAIELLNRAVQLEPDNVDVRKLLAEQLLSENVDAACMHYAEILQHDPRNTEAMYNLSRIYAGKGEYEKALEYINSYLAEKPGAIDALMLKGKIFMNMERWRDADRTFEKVLREKEDSDALLNRGIALMHLQKYTDAVEHINRCIQLKGETPDAVLALAKCNELAGDLESALRHYTKALEIHKGSTKLSPEARDGKIRVLEKLNRYPELFEFYAQITANEDAVHWRLKAVDCLMHYGTDDAILDFLDKSIARYPDSVELLVKKAEFEEAKGWPDKAVLTYRRVLEIELTNAEIWYRCAKLYSKLGNLASATECIDKAIELRPDNARYLGEKGRIAYEMHELDVAVRNFDMVLERDVENVDAWIALGKIMLDIERYPEALKCFDKATELNEGYADAWAYKGAALLKMGKTEEAISHFQKALSIDRNNITAQYYIGSILLRNGDENGRKILSSISHPDMQADIHVQFGNALMKKKEYREAIAQFEEAVKIEREKIEGWNNLGVSLAMTGSIEEAIYAFDEAIEIENTYTNAWYNKGIALLNLESWNEALDALTVCSRKEGFSPDAQLAVAVALLTLRKFENAIKMLEELSEKAPSLNVFYNLAIAYLQIEMPENAVKYARKAFEIENNDQTKYLMLYTMYMCGDLDACLKFIETAGNPGFSCWQYWLLRAYIEIVNGMMAEAIKSLDKAMQNSKDPVSWLLRCFVYLCEGKYGDAKRSIDVYFIKNAPSFDAWSLKGLVHYYLGDYQNALKCLTSALKIKNDEITNYNCAIVCFKLNQYDDALQYLEAARKLAPHNEKYTYYKLKILQHIEQISEASVEELTGETMGTRSRESILDTHDLTITLFVNQRQGVELNIKNTMFRAVQPFTLELGGAISSGRIEVPQLSSKEEKTYTLNYRFNDEDEEHVVPGIDVAIEARLYSKRGRVHCEIGLQNLKPFKLTDIRVRPLSGLGYTPLVDEKIVRALEPLETRKLQFTMVPAEVSEQINNWTAKFGADMVPEIVCPEIEVQIPSLRLPDYRIEDNYDFRKNRTLKLSRLVKTMDIKSKAVEEILKMHIVRETVIAETALLDELELKDVKG